MFPRVCQIWIWVPISLVPKSLLHQQFPRLFFVAVSKQQRRWLENESSYFMSALSSPQAPHPGFDVHALQRRWTDTGMSNRGTKEPSPQASSAQSPPEPQRRGRGRPRKQQQVGAGRLEKASWSTEWPHASSRSPSRSRSDRRLRSGPEDDRKAARTKAPKLHPRLSLKFFFFFFFFMFTHI